VALLLEHGADANVKDRDKDTLRYTPLHAVFRFYIDGLVHPDFTQAQHDDVLAIIKILLAHGADLRARDGIWGGQALHHAALVGYPDVVALLLDAGAAIDAKNNDRITPLGIAASTGQVETMALLIERGAQVNVQDDLGNTPLHYAVQSRDVPSIRLLLERNAKVTPRNREGVTALMLAACDYERDREFIDDADNAVNAPYEQFAPTLVRELVKRGCNINEKDKEGDTALHRAVGAGRIAVARELLTLGAKVNAQDKYGITPLHIATEHGNTQTAALLLQHGASTSVKSKRGETPLDIALAIGDQAMVKLLREHGAAPAKE
jgi:ankyrin repeat protein